MRAKASWVGAAAIAVGLLLVAPSAASAQAGPSTRTITGSVERLHLDLLGDQNAPSADEVALIRDGSTAVRVPASEVAQVPTGTTVSVNVSSPSRSLPTLSTESGSSITSLRVVSAAATAPATPATSVHDVTVVLATWPGQPVDSVTTAALSATINGTVNDYWSTVTNHRIGFKVSSARGWITVPTAACVNGDPATGTFGFWKDVETAVGFVEGPGRHLVVHIPENSPCGGSAGIGTVGSSPASGGLLWVRGATADVVGHELGHNLSLGHSSVLSCATGGIAVTDAVTANCVKHSYRDLGDIMGMSWNHLGFLNAAHLARLGMLDSVVEVTNPTTVTLAPASATGGVRSIRLRDGSGAYYVELHAATGLDSWLGTTPGWVDAGVTVRRDFTTSSVSLADQARLPARESFLLDADPTTPDTSFGSARTTLPAGQWIDLAGGAFGIRVSSAGGVGASAFAKVEVRVNGVAPASPIAPSSGRWSGGAARGAVTARSGRLMVPVRVLFTPTVSASSTSRMAAPVAVAASASRVSASNAWTATAVSVGASSTSLYARVLPVSALRVSKAWKAQVVNGSPMQRALVATSRGASASYAFTGRSVALLANSSPNAGQVRILVDGHQVAITSLVSARSHPAMVVWASANLTLGHHIVTVRSVSTAPVSLSGIAQVELGSRPAN